METQPEGQCIPTANPHRITRGARRPLSFDISECLHKCILERAGNSGIPPGQAIKGCVDLQSGPSSAPPTPSLRPRAATAEKSAERVGGGGEDWGAEPPVEVQRSTPRMPSYKPISSIFCLFHCTFVPLSSITHTHTQA